MGFGGPVCYLNPYDLKLEEKRKQKKIKRKPKKAWWKKINLK